MKWKFWEKTKIEKPPEPKRKKYIVRILIILTDEDKRKEGQRYEIKMKDGWTWNLEDYNRNLIVRDEDGDIVREFNWQAGYTVQYKIEYEWKEWYESET